MDAHDLVKRAESAAALLDGFRADAAFILGSGWSGLEDGMTVRRSIPYSIVDGLGGTRVAGHEGRLLAGLCGDTRILAFLGRRHWYEGEGWGPVLLPIFIARAAGARILTLTNAAGGISTDLHPGDLMVIDDHINFMGVNPLVGAWEPTLGPQFPDQSRLYDSELRDLLHRRARDAGFEAAHGVYLAASGPAYETPAEVAAFARLGANAVGMSTVPEAMLANRLGLRVCAVSCISNRAARAQGAATLSHQEVIEATRQAAPRMKALLTGFAHSLHGLASARAEPRA